MDDLEEQIPRSPSSNRRWLPIVALVAIVALASEAISMPNVPKNADRLKRAALPPQPAPTRARPRPGLKARASRWMCRSRNRRDAS